MHGSQGPSYKDDSTRLALFGIFWDSMGRGETQKELEDVYTGLAEVFLVVLIV